MAMTELDARTTLEAQRRAVCEQMESLDAEAAMWVEELGTDGLEEGGGDVGAAVVERDRARAIRSRLMDELLSIDAALERLARGTYGTCVDCREEISAERLALLPGAKRCVRCQALNG